jgi:hypothetical protein
VHGSPRMRVPAATLGDCHLPRCPHIHCSLPPTHTRQQTAHSNQTEVPVAHLPHSSRLPRIDGKAQLLRHTSSTANSTRGNSRCPLRKEMTPSARVFPNRLLCLTRSSTHPCFMLPALTTCLKKNWTIHTTLRQYPF